jgi:hypothetical protein
MRCFLLASDRSSFHLPLQRHLAEMMPILRPEIGS